MTEEYHFPQEDEDTPVEIPEDFVLPDNSERIAEITQAIADLKATKKKEFDAYDPVRADLKKLLDA